MFSVTLKLIYFNALFLFLLLSLIQRNIAEQDVKVIFTEVECRNLSSKISKIDCHESFENKHSTITVQWQYAEDVTAITAKIKIVLLLQGQRSVELYKLDTDFCSKQPFNLRRNVMQVFYKAIQQATVNFPLACPFKKDIMYGVQHFEMDPEMLPTYIPELNFSSDMDVYSGKEALVSFRALATLCKKQSYCQKYW